MFIIFDFRNTNYMKNTFCTMVTGEKKDFIVLLETSPKFPYSTSNIAFVKVEAISLGEAGRKAIENFKYDANTDCRPVVRSYFE